jgi:signal peptidase II
MRAVPLNRYVAFFSIVVAGCAVDLVTKNWIVNRQGMPARQTEWIWQGVFGLRTTHNEGALFGLGQGYALLFAVMSIAAGVAILLWLFYAGAARDRLLCVALACVTAGILGNLHDRLGLHGLTWSDTDRYHQAGEPVLAVRDWIIVMIGSYQWPAFNVADSLLCCGAVLLVWHALVAGPKTPQQTSSARELKADA